MMSKQHYGVSAKSIRSGPKEITDHGEKVKCWNIAKRDFYKSFYKSHHGLHVIDDKFVKGCHACAERAKIIAICRMRGEDPTEALAKGKYDQRRYWSVDKGGENLK